MSTSEIQSFLAEAEKVSLTADEKAQLKQIVMDYVEKNTILPTSL